MFPLILCLRQLQAVRLEGGTLLGRNVSVAFNPRVANYSAHARSKRKYKRKHMEEGDWNKRKRREEVKQKVELHDEGITEYCDLVEERWTDWSDCSADCGGGMQTATLVERTVLHPRLSYRKDCPPLCDRSSKDASKQMGCGEPRYQICALTVCRKDCSVVDLGNRLPSAGSPIVWKYSLAGPPGDRCFFQFWRILENSPPRLQLLGEAQPLSEVDKEVIETVAERAFNELMIHTTDEYSHLDVALGFRGCKLKSVDPEINRSAIATICLSGAEWFNRADQKVALDLDQLEFLSSAWRDSSIEWAKELALCAARKEGVGIEENVVHIGDITHSTRPQYQFSVTMSPKAPSMPTLLEPGWFELGDSIEVKVDALTRDNGVAINTIIVSVQRKFGKHLKGILEKCRFLALPECQSNSTDHPCVDTVTKRGHSIVLYNLPFASVFNVAVESENAAGRSDALRLEVATRAKPGVPYTDCAVIAWSCGEETTPLSNYPTHLTPSANLRVVPLFLSVN